LLPTSGSGGTIKELAQLDGAFIIAENGAVVSGCRYLDASTAGIELPFGLESRHLAATSISKRLGVIVVTVLTSGTVRLFAMGGSWLPSNSIGERTSALP
jgi:DNA integrity scanning protein DisA with diadenylate cyclase activity